MTAPATLRMTVEDFASLAGCHPSPTALPVLRGTARPSDTC